MKKDIKTAAFFKKPQKLKNFAIAAAAVLAVALAAIFSAIETSGGAVYDFTQNSLYSLSNKTVNVLDELETDISIYTLYSPGNGNETIETLLKSYAAKSKKVSIKNVDPSGPRTELSFAENAASLSAGSIIVANKDGSRYSVLSSGSMYVTDQKTLASCFRAENKITTAVNYAATGSIVRIRLLYGHQETADSELTEFKSYLDLLNYSVLRYDYLRSSSPLDPKTDILIAVSPKTDFSSEELKAIKTFMQNGGTFILLLDNAYYSDSTHAVEKTERDQPRLTQLLKEYNLSVNFDVLVSENPENAGLRSTALITEPIENSPVTGNAVLSECSSISILSDANAVVTPLFKTKSQTYSSPTAYGIDLQKKETSVSGSFITAALSKGENSKLIVFSTSSFLNNSEFLTDINNTLISKTLALTDIGLPVIELEPKEIYEVFEIKSGFVRAFLTAVIAVILPVSVAVLLYLRRLKRLKPDIFLKKKM